MSEPSPSDFENIPSTHLVRSICAANLNWRSACGELIDNAFDAGASAVALAFSTRRGVGTFTITDNGAGCEDPCAFVRLGGHVGKASTRLGRYGIGAKEAALWIGQDPPRIDVTSTHAGKRRFLSYDWLRVIKTNRWAIDPSALIVSDARPGLDVGTVVSITSPNLRRVPHGKDWDNFIASLGYLYAPAIKRGKQISVSRNGEAPTPVPPYVSPPLEPGHVDQVIEVGGKLARVYAGIVTPGTPNPKCGFTYVYGFRVILEACGHGAGPFNYARVAGIVDLGEGWVLAKNKDNISQHTEDLYTKVQEVCGDLLRRAEVTGLRLESAEFDSAADRLLNEAVFGGTPNTKAERGKGESHGTKIPTCRGGKHTRAEREQDGETYPRLARGSLRIQYQDDEPDRIGHFSEPATVMLNPNHAWVASMRSRKNVEALVATAVPLLASKALTGERQQVMRKILPDHGGPQEKFESMMGRCLGSVRVDGRDIAKAAAVPAPVGRDAE
jgi:hypothetical protein